MGFSMQQNCGQLVALVLDSLLYRATEFYLADSVMLTQNHFALHRDHHDHEPIQCCYYYFVVHQWPVVSLLSYWALTLDCHALALQRNHCCNQIWVILKLEHVTVPSFLPIRYFVLPAKTFRCTQYSIG